MELMLTIRLDNAAFDGEELGGEIAHILRNLAERVEEQSRAYLTQDGQNFRAADSNGLTVGRLEITQEEN